MAERIFRQSCRDYRINVLFGCVSLDVKLKGKWRNVCLAIVERDESLRITKTYRKMHSTLRYSLGHVVREMFKEHREEKARRERELNWGPALTDDWS